MGGGSNLLVRDEGFPGLVLHLNIRGESRARASGDRVEYDVPAGTPWDDFVLATCEQELSGVECLAGIPGLTGGTPVQNVGAYGQEVAHTIHQVRAYDRRSRSFRTLSREECRFAYRSSCFNTDFPGRYFVTSVTFALNKGGRADLDYAELRNRFRGEFPTPMQVYHAVRELRTRKGMLLSANDPDSRSAGSFFKNPVVPASKLTRIASDLAIDPGSVPHWPSPEDESDGQRVKLSAAWLVERAGFPKGFVSGRAGISARHSLALINRGGATFAEIAGLRDRIRSEVGTKFGILLDQEPVELSSNTQDGL